MPYGLAALAAEDRVLRQFGRELAAVGQSRTEFPPLEENAQ
jgi:hypothetical protein